MADDENDGASAGESRGQMLQRHKRELAEVKKAIARLGKRAKDEGGKMLEEVTTRQQAELAQLVRLRQCPAGGGEEGIAASAATAAARRSRTPTRARRTRRAYRRRRAVARRQRCQQRRPW